VPGIPSRELLRKLLTFAGGSAVATVCSEVVILVAYGVLHWSASVSAVLAWLAGAVPNYWLGRRWTWRRRDRPDLVAEVLPYVVVVLATLVLAVVTTRTVSDRLSAAHVGHTQREVAVAAAFLGVYVVVFLLRFWLLDRLFARLQHRDRRSAQDAPEPAPTPRRTP
jgi:putative flippase GtrA